MRKRTSGLIAACLALALPAGAVAQTLQDALSATYNTNPTLLAERARVRAVEQQSGIARSAWLPSVSAGAGYAFTETIPDVEGEANQADGSNDPFARSREPIQSNGTTDLTLSATQTLYRGGRNGAAVSEARARVAAAQAELVDVEQSVLLAALEAYVDVQRDMKAVAIRLKNVEVLARQFSDADTRFELGEATRTDVAQADARLAGARSQLARARADLAATRARYERVVGAPAGDLAPTPPLPLLPAGVEEAFEEALANQPQLEAARRNVDAARAAVREVEGRRRPTVSITGSAARNSFLYDIENIPSERRLAVTGRVTVPLSTGGLNRALTQQSRALESQSRQRLAEQRRVVRERVASAWSQYNATGIQIQASEQEVQANEIAVRGVRSEEENGLRTTLDILNAEQELLNARLNLVTAQRDAYVAAHNLLASVGRLTPAELGLSPPSGAAQAAGDPEF